MTHQLITSDLPYTGIIQIGAHAGEEARQHHQKVGPNMIWIEAQPELMGKLRRNVSPFGHQAINATLWNRSGVNTTFHVTNNSVSSSLLEPYKHIERYGNQVCVKKKINVVTITWADLVQQHPELLNPVFNCLIIDCQGAEYQVLQGIGPDLIQQFDSLEVEISNNEQYRNQKIHTEVTALLNSWGYGTTHQHNAVHGCALYTKQGMSQ